MVINGRSRELNTADATHPIAKFGLRTATGTLRKHLQSLHLAAWVQECDVMGITIKTNAAQLAAEGLRGLDTAAWADLKSRTPYTNEGFVDAIVEFIIGDDIVRHP
jgi:hypothetical protein